jgi:hypothetical protein
MGRIKNPFLNLSDIEKKSVKSRVKTPSLLYLKRKKRISYCQHICKTKRILKFIIATQLLIFAKRFNK